MCGVRCWKDHRLIVSKIKFHVQSKRRPKDMKPPKRLNTSKLKDWHTFCVTVYNKAMGCLGPATRTGLMRTAQKSSSCYKRNNVPTGHATTT